MTQTRYMLIFSIGPVQSLITQARKTRDLWLGSYLLAKLMEAAMVGIDSNSIVFPANYVVEGYISNIPNRYIAIFDSIDEAEQATQKSIENLWNKGDTKIEGKWHDICQEIWMKLFANHPEKDYVQVIWDRQTDFDKFFEVYWVAVPEPTEDELKEEQAKTGNAEKTLYQYWLEKAQKAFDARKRLRNFKAQNEWGEKSTVSGEREALHGHRTSRQAIRNFWRELVAPGSYSAKDIDKEGLERLDAIDTIKRFAFHSSSLKGKLEQMDFPSTSSIATASFVRFLIEKKPNSDLTDTLEYWLTQTDGELAKMRPSIRYLDQLAQEKHKSYQSILKRDGDCFFEETFVPETLQKLYPGTKADAAKAARALKKLLKTTGAHPSPYYALIQMDGDHMGPIINGVKVKDAHSKISKALSTFAHEEAPKIVQENHPGRLVYAGGDDLIAFFPLVGLLRMANELQEQYTKTVSKEAPDEKKTQVTASMGIAIAHHLTPLSFVRRATFEAEKLAKNRYGRNALVVTILRRSGEQTRVGCRWNYEYEEDQKYTQQPISLFQEFYKLFIEKKLSVSSIHTLLDEAPALVGLTPDAQQSEIKRVLQRQRKNDKVLPDQKAVGLAWAVVHLAQAMDKVIDEEQVYNQNVTKAFELYADTYRAGLVEVFGWLLVMVFLAREEHYLDIDERNEV